MSDAPRSDPPRSDRAAQEATVVEAVAAVPGVARLVPSFRQVLTAAAQRLLSAEATPATGVDIVEEDTGVFVYVDLYTEATRPAGQIVDDVDRTVKALFGAEDRLSLTVKVRVMGVMGDPGVNRTW